MHSNPALRSASSPVSIECACPLALAADIVFDKMSLPVLEFLVGPGKEMEDGCAELLLARLVRKAKKELADGDGEDQHKAALLLANLEGNAYATIDDETIRTARERLNILEKRASLGLADLAMPNDFKCPITTFVMKDPVVASDGNSYERAAIQRVLNGNRTSPITRERLATQLFPNLNLKKRIAEFETDVINAAEVARAAVGTSPPAKKRARRA